MLSPRVRLIVLWVTALGAPLVAGYCILSAYSYAWLNAAGSWSAERASLWASAAFFFFCLFAAVSVNAIVRLLRYYNSLPRLPDRDEVQNQ
jgi:TRAP-type C4-dicarboxylate transport system permease small subunit